MSKAVDPLAAALFGPDAFDEQHFLSPQLRLFVETILRKNWRRFGLEVERERVKLGPLQEQVKILWQGAACLAF